MALIDSLQALAERAAPLRPFAGAAMLLFGLATGALILSFGDDRYLWPAMVGLLWSASTYAFIATFRFVPRPAAGESGVFARLRRRLRRTWFWLLALICAGTTLAVVIISVRLASIWLRHYG